MIKSTKNFILGFSQKNLKRLQRKPGMRYLYIRGYDVTYAEFNIFKLWSKPHKTMCEVFYQQKYL